MPKTQAVHVRDPRTVGGGWRPSDLIKFPVPVLLTFFVIRWIGRHFIPIALFLIVLVMVFAVESWAMLILYAFALLIAYALLLYADIAWRFKGSKTFRNLSIALWRKQKLKWCWNEVMVAMEIKKEPFPKPKKLRYDRNGLKFTLKLRKHNKTSGDVAVQSPEIAGSLNAFEVKVETPLPAMAVVHVSWGDPTEREIRPGDVEQTSKVNTVAPVNDANGQAIDLPIDLSLLVVGKTGAGKSTLFWDYLEALNKKKIPYRLRVVDPAGGVELADLKDSPNCVDYVDSPEKLEDFMTRSDAAMQKTFKEMERQGIRNAPVGYEFPVDIMVIDEILMLPTQDANSALGIRMATGRKGNHIVIGLSQLSQVDSLGRVRDLFPQRMCLGVKDATVTNAVLGQDAEKRGAKCSTIDTPGVGYMYKDGVSGFIKFRAANIFDDETEHIAQGGIIEEKTQAFKSTKLVDLKLRRTAVYKFYNSDGRLLYTGIAWAPEKRQKQHSDPKNKDYKKWWPEVDPEETEIVWYNNRKLAKKAETYSIRNENPKYNIAEAKKEVEKYDF